ncbi:NAD(P)-binding Rossmann-fold containing protein [Glarea lozoyensis ATCC 20868]|uniref:NAD(P)-binding Rossmann-fold containing protein n=1 Tax=Glarea lozoyensis (strain ATCC 20868 / MF5171) TaxID=1116229 RepID=S3DZ03_GLAL2|nr:NAD(P)-binding Rossmann-fold containing protein [Glarea lozoyensis ATCC 20868]EPE37166.1 NAD(P)-binding Rossmann-fold containing protein [Glarea lozoyensis ATCC 20868]
MSSISTSGVALITGAAAGIGEETGYAFAQAGALGVVFADIHCKLAAENAEKSKAYATNTQYRALSIKVDTTDPISVQEMVDFTVREFGRLDYNVNSAGLGASSLAPTADVDINNFDAILNVNTRGVMLCVRAVSKFMISQEPRTHTGRHGKQRSLGRGCIVNLGSVASFSAGRGMMAYVASKHAVMGITKVAAFDNAKHEIRVNAVCPTWVETPMLDRGLKRWPALGESIKTKTPLGRAADPEEVANVVVYLCSPSSSYINGTGIMIDSGMSVTAHL